MVASTASGGGSMLHLFLGLRSVVRVRRGYTDGSVFRLHYRLTVLCLLAATFLVTSRQVQSYLVTVLRNIVTHIRCKIFLNHFFNSLVFKCASLSNTRSTWARR